MLQFELYTDYKRKFWNLNFTTQIIALCFSIFSFLILQIIEEDSIIIQILVILLLVLFLISSFIRLNSFFSKYESESKLVGEIIFSTNSIQWIEKEFSWEKLKHIYIEYHEIDGLLDYAESTSQNNRSDGMNKITILLLDNSSYCGWYKIKNKSQLIALYNLIDNVISFNDLNYEICKSLSHPSNYKEHQELKKRVSNRKHSNL